jgi:hypothetical protein
VTPDPTVQPPVRHSRKDNVQSWSRILAFGAASLIILWRLSQLSPWNAWKDFPLVVGFYALVAWSGLSEKVRTNFQGVIVSYLIAVYLVGQVPLTLAHLGFLR